jgi:hypothetical protein
MAKKRVDGPVAGGDRQSGPGSMPALRWDETLRELRLGRLLIKRFRQPAPIQELILRKFQAAGWPPSTPSPLPPSPQHDPGVHLRDAVKCLNRAQHPPGIRFHVNHGSTVIYWTVEEAADTNDRRRSKKPSRKPQAKNEKTRRLSRSESALRASFDKRRRRA